MKIIFRERKRKKSYHKKLERILRKTLNKYVDSDILEKLQVEIFLGSLVADQSGNLKVIGSLPFRKFRIELDNTQYAWRLKQAVRHEAIHMKQILNREWIPLSKDFTSIWKGNIIQIKEYWDHPWEIEAYELENIR